MKLLCLILVVSMCKDVIKGTVLKYETRTTTKEQRTSDLLYGSIRGLLM